MPKLPFKRKGADDGSSLSAYIPTQMVDYTSLPPIEEDTAMMRFKRLPLIARIGAVLLPIVLLLGAGVGIWQFLYATSPTQAEAPPAPTIQVSDARVVSRDAIAVEAQVEHVPDGTPASVELLAGGQPVTWADAAQSTAAVQGGRVSLRLVKAEAAAVALDPNAAYTVQVTVGEAANAITSQLELTVPEVLKNAFFSAEVAAASPTPEPTPSPTPEATPEPTPEPAGPPKLVVAIDSTLLISPTLGTEPVANVQTGATFEPMLRSGDSKWFLVQQNDRVGWLHADQVKIDSASSAKVPVVTPSQAAVNAGPNKAVVFNGGNIRYRPDVKRGTVLGQLHARQTITLVGKTADGQWFRVVAPEAEGWVSVSLLTIDPKVMAKVPVAGNP